MVAWLIVENNPGVDEAYVARSIRNKFSNINRDKKRQKRWPKESVLSLDVPLTDDSTTCLGDRIEDKTEFKVSPLVAFGNKP